MAEKNILFILNTNEYSQFIVKSFLEEKKYKIILIVDNLEYFKEIFFDIWDKFELVINNKQTDMQVLKSLEGYHNLNIVNFINLNEEGNFKPMTLMHLLKQINYAKLIFINQFLDNKRKRANYEYNNLYESYLNEVAITRKLKNYYIIRTGILVHKVDMESIKLGTAVEDLILDIRSIINMRNEAQYSYLISNITMLNLRPLYENINFVYNDKMGIENKMIIQYCKFPNIYDMHKSGKNLIIYGFLFKLTTLILHRCLKKL
jgi:hypothetical protein